VQLFLSITYTWLRRCVIALVGGAVVLTGIVMIVTPGPAFVVIPAGLAILGLEFACARRWLHQLRAGGTRMIETARMRSRLWFRSANDRTHQEPSLCAVTVHEHATGERALLQNKSSSDKASTEIRYYRIP
jgi:hypothetical protein